jgi:hypothetical protein
MGPKTFVLIGFPVACLMARGFDITPEGVRPVPPVPKGPPLPQAHTEPKAAAAAETNAPPSIAVLPLRNRNHPVVGSDPCSHALLRRMGLEGSTDTK